MPTATYYPVTGRITLYSYLHHREPLRLTATAITDLDGEVVIANWQINEARTEVRLTIEQNGPNYQIERTYPCEVKDTPLSSPGRNYKWSEFNGCWVNRKTGARFINA